MTRGDKGGTPFSVGPDLEEYVSTIVVSFLYNKQNSKLFTNRMKKIILFHSAVRAVRAI